MSDHVRQPDWKLDVPWLLAQLRYVHPMKSELTKKIAFVLLAGLGALGVLRATCNNVVDDADEAASDPKQILGRVWFDRLPKNRSDDVTIALWFGGGIGLYDKGSTWRSTVDVFEFERRKDVLDITFLHDKKNSTTSFKISKCDDLPPFDLCLTLSDPPRGPKVLHGFARRDELDANVPWSRDLEASAKSKAAAAR